MTADRQHIAVAYIWCKDESVTPDVTDMNRWRACFGHGATFGDNTKIPADYIEVVSQTLIDCTVPVNWHAGDVLLINNRTVVHGRLPYTGSRKVYLALA